MGYLKTTKELLPTFLLKRHTHFGFRILFLFALMAGMLPEVAGQKLTANFGSARFRHSDTLSTFEYYVRIPSGSVNFVNTPENKLQATVNCQVAFFKKDSLVMVDNFNLSSPAVDSLIAFDHFNAQRRAYLKPDEYKITVDIKDLNNKEGTTISLVDDIRLTYASERITMSDIILLEDYNTSKVKDAYYRNGYHFDVHNTTFYPWTQKRLKYYVEIYNINKTIPEGEDFLLSLGVEDAQTYKRIKSVGTFVKKKSNDKTAQLGNLDISKLPSGNYNFFIEVKDRNNKLLMIRRKFFQRSNPVLNVIENTDPNTTFAASLDLRTIKYYSAAFRPIASEDEKRNIALIVNTEDTTMARSFIYSFWYKRHPDNPVYYWNEYKKWVDYTEERLSSKRIRGYTTALGRVYLKYGPPNRIEDERNDPMRDIQGTTTPYQIWYYNNIKGTNQRNKLFVFVDRTKSGTKYEMVHSDVRGENYIDDWLGHTRWKSILHNYGGFERIDNSRDDNRFNNGTFGSPGHWDTR